MATTISYGFILPDTGDKGSVWFPALETNITKLAAHTHDGSNSAKILTTSITAVTQAIASGAAWVSPVNGVYEQELTLPPNVNYADVFIMIKDASGNQLFLDVKPGSTGAKYKVYSNDTTLSATAYILV